MCVVQMLRKEKQPFELTQAYWGQDHTEDCAAEAFCCTSYYPCKCHCVSQFPVEAVDEFFHHLLTSDIGFYNSYFFFPYVNAWFCMVYALFLYLS